MQLVYFNDLHKNLGCNRGITSEFSIIPALFAVLPVNFFALPFSSVSFFSRALSPPASNCPVQTDISIAQKTCVFRPVDISVPAVKRSKLIYQFAYALPELNSLSQNLTVLPAPSGREPTLSVCSLRSQPAPPKGELIALPEAFIIHPMRFRHRKKAPPSGELARERLRGLASPWGSWRA